MMKIALLATVAACANVVCASDWSQQGGNPGMTKYASDNVPAGALHPVYEKRFYSKWTNWTGSYGNYHIANNVVIRDGQAVVLANDAPDTAGTYGPLYHTQFNWNSGATTFKEILPGSPDGSPRWFHGGQHPSEIDSHHFKFPLVWGDDNRIYARRGGDQRALGAMNVANHTWKYLPSDGPITGWAGDTAAYLNFYKGRLLYRPGDTRDNWEYVSADVSAAAWVADAPGKSSVWINNNAPRTANGYTNGLTVGDIPKVAQDVAVVAGWASGAAPARTHITASNINTGQQLWTRSYDSASAGVTGFYAGTSDYYQFVATEDGHYVMFDRPNASTTNLRVLDLQTGGQKWSKPVGGDASPLVGYHDEFVYVVARGEQMKVNADTGEIAWRTANAFTGDVAKLVDGDPVYRSLVLTDDSMWFINNGAAGADHLIGLRTSDGQLIQDLDLSTLANTNETQLVVQDLVAADGLIGVFINSALAGDPHAGGSGQKFQDLYVFKTAAVPEPTGAAMILTAVLLTLSSRRKRSDSTRRS